MAANRYTLRLYRFMKLELQEDANLDPRDDAYLREPLERLVLAKRGTLELDLSEWSMAVHSLGGGMIRASVSIAPSGATQIRR